MKIAMLGKFQKMHDEEYIARSFESLGHEVERIHESIHLDQALVQILDLKPKIVMYFKLNNHGDIAGFLRQLRHYGIKTVCWVFDLYFGYPREFRLKGPAFKADYVFSTDGGHQREFRAMGINHHCVRQGIHSRECQLIEGERKGLVFVGSENPSFPARTLAIADLQARYGLEWIGRRDSDECRGMALNELYSRKEIVVGDSYYSPHYWSNRIVETLGRGGFLIHQEVEGLREEYPHLVTYKRGDLADLRAKIDHYLAHPEEREELRRINFEWVRDRYTMDRKCVEILKIMNLYD